MNKIILSKRHKYELQITADVDWSQAASAFIEPFKSLEPSQLKSHPFEFAFSTVVPMLLPGMILKGIAYIAESLGWGFGRIGRLIDQYFEFAPGKTIDMSMGNIKNISHAIADKLGLGDSDIAAAITTSDIQFDMIKSGKSDLPKDPNRVKKYFLKTLGLQKFSFAGFIMSIIIQILKSLIILGVINAASQVITGKPMPKYRDTETKNKNEKGGIGSSDIYWAPGELSPNIISPSITMPDANTKNIITTNIKPSGNESEISNLVHELGVSK